MSQEGSQWLRQLLLREDVRLEFARFLDGRAKDCSKSAFEELRKSEPSMSKAVGFATQSQVYDQLLDQLALYLKEEQV